jgi:hypothetical protein
MKSRALVQRFSEYQDVSSVLIRRGKVYIKVSEQMAWRILEALRLYAMVEEALKEFGKRIKPW